MSVLVVHVQTLVMLQNNTLTAANEHFTLQNQSRFSSIMFIKQIHQLYTN